MIGRQFAVTSGRPAVMREVHCIFVAVNFHGLVDAILLVRVVGVAARIDSPHVPFGATVHDPLSRDLACTAALGDAEGEGMSLEGVGDTWHRADHGQAVRRIGNWAVDVAADTLRPEQRHACHGILDVPFQPVQIVGIELETEVVRHRVVGPCPGRLAVALVGAEIEAGCFLAQVVGRIHIPEQGQFAPVLFAPRGDFGHRFRQEILVAHNGKRHLPAAKGQEPLADTFRVVACSVDHVLAADITFFRVHDPFAVLAADARCRCETQDLAAVRPRTLGKRLGDLCRIDIPVERVPQTPFQIMDLKERIAFLHLLRRAHFHVHAHVAAHAGHIFELSHSLLRMGKAKRTADVIVERIVDFFSQTPVKLQRIALDVHDAETAGKGRAVARRVPGGAGGELVLFQEHAVGPATFCQVIKGGHSDDAATDDDNTGCSGN